MTDSTGQGALVIIPARGGSVGIPLKNLQRVHGQSLLARAVLTARHTPGVGQVVVSTDHEGIAAEARAAGATVIERPADISGSLATSESAVLYTLDQIEVTGGTVPEVTVLMQCTSPFIRSSDLHSAVEKVTSGSYDVVLSATASHAFHWTTNGGLAEPMGHDSSVRLRRQDMTPQYRETGAFYVMRTSGLRAAQHRFFGRIGLQDIPEEISMEIDSPHDLALAQALAPHVEPVDEHPIMALITDFDGVHTDDHASITSDGSESVRVHRGDGMGVAQMRKAGIPFVIVSTETNPVVTRRGEKLQVEVFQGVANKAAVVDAWVEEHHLDPQHVAFVGNDINDLAAMSRVGWPLAVADAHPAVKAAARLVLTRAGGYGAVREACDLVVATSQSAN